MDRRRSWQLSDLRVGGQDQFQGTAYHVGRPLGIIFFGSRTPAEPLTSGSSVTSTNRRGDFARRQPADLGLGRPGQPAGRLHRGLGRRAPAAAGPIPAAGAAVAAAADPDRSSSSSTRSSGSSHGLPLRRAEDYAAEFPELAEGGIPCDLLYEEFHLRRRSGEPVDIKEYQDRFPDRAGELGRLLGVVSTYATTTLRAPQPMVHLNPGDQVDDFDLLTLLGEGAFAKVFLARQRSLQRLVALKVSAARGNEPQTLAQLDHPHIVRVYDQKVVPGGGMRLLYMPYLAGGTLQSVLEHARAVPADKRSGRTLIEAIDRVLQRRGEEPPVESPLRSRLSELTWPQAVAWLGARLADALHYAHRRGVLHRDIKPANILLTADGAPRLADFNVGHCSKLDGVSPRAFFGGSLVYMSPEQLEAFNPAHDRDPDSLDGRERSSTRSA